MSIASEITRLQNAKAALKSSIEAKGVTVDPSATLDSYSELVDSIPTGGGEYEPICFTSLEDGNTFRLNREIAISVDGKQTWQTLAANTSSPAINTGEKIYFKATENASPFGGTTSDYYKFSTAKTCNVSGHPYSLYAKGSFYFFALLFSGTKIVDASGLTLEELISNQCYYQMFQGCTSLKTAPELPSTILANNCYASMFSGCTSLVTAPNLPATTLANSCYYQMFQGCTSLKTAPNLPATTLATNCCREMFSGCSSLTTAPELPATTLVPQCYQEMFNECTSLVTAPNLPATTLADHCYYEMFQRCTSLSTAPNLPATKLADSCCYSMFEGCTSLVTAPELPATTLAKYCYNRMFFGCSRLNYIKALFTTTPSTSYTGLWVNGVASTGTFVKNRSATWTTVGDNGVPTGWTVETNA